MSSVQLGHVVVTSWYTWCVFFGDRMASAFPFFKVTWRPICRWSSVSCIDYRALRSQFLQSSLWNEWGLRVVPWGYPNSWMISWKIPYLDGNPMEISCMAQLSIWVACERKSVTHFLWKLKIISRHVPMKNQCQLSARRISRASCSQARGFPN